MRLSAAFSFLLILLMVAAVSGCAKKEEPKSEAPAPAISAVEEGQVLFEKMCGVCHTLGRATARSETKEKWESIIKEMQGKKPGFISDAEAEKILAYLSSKHGK
jgi:mono/diheme cytochrome c family protein